MKVAIGGSAELITCATSRLLLSTFRLRPDIRYKRKVLLFGLLSLLLHAFTRRRLLDREDAAYMGGECDINRSYTCTPSAQPGGCEAT